MPLLIPRRVIPLPLPTTTTLSRRLIMTSSPSPPSNPLVLIIGATGTGKSALAVHLAQHLSRTTGAGGGGGGGAEIINADAMQLYRGLPTITNKLAAAEQRGVPHHLLDHIGADDEPWTVQRYIAAADGCVGQIRARGKTPVVVGGTGYYVHGLVFADGTLGAQTPGGGGEEEEADADTDGDVDGGESGRRWLVLEAGTPEIYRRLQEVDPEMARRWHPNDRRKIQRSLEIWLRTGRRASEVYAEQRRVHGHTVVSDSVDGEDGGEQEVGPTNSVALRYDPLIFWLEAEDNVLKDRLNRRVDGMVVNGLLEEAKELGALERDMRAKEMSVDKSKGIWVSIGYKEMEPWVQAQRTGSMQEKEVSLLKDSCIEAVKAGTRRYAKRQNRYVRIRFAHALARANASDKLFLLDCTDLERWREHVQEPAEKILDAFLQGRQLPDQKDLSELARQTFIAMDDKSEVEERVARVCDVCDKVLMTEKQWATHIQSRQHKRVLQGIRKREMNEIRKQAADLSSKDALG